MSGFYEWRAAAAPGEPKQLFHLHGEDGALLGLAGSWERWKRPGRLSLETFTVVTTATNATSSGTIS